MPSPAPVSRRLALGTSAALAALLAGCDIDPPADRDEGPVSRAADLEDHGLLIATATLLADAAAFASAGAARFPDLAQLLAPLAAAHGAHHARLSGALPDEAHEAPPTPRVPRREPALLRQVVRHEREVLREVTTASRQSASGDLARVLASIAASTAQHLMTLEARRTQ